MRIMTGKIIFLLIIAYLCSIKAQDFSSKPVKLEALVPRGIRVTMQDDDYSSFQFIGTLRRGAETKRWQSYVPRAKNGLWIFTDRNYELKVGDNINYTISITKHNSTHELKGTWRVSKFVVDEEMLTCEISETNTLYSNKICKDTLIFSEEFNDPLDLKWHKEQMFPQGPDYPFNAYSKDNVRINNGMLIITPIRTLSGFSQSWNMGYACTGEPGTQECKQTSSGYQILPPVVSGKITTRKLFSFKYGRIDVRAKLPAGDWLIPEINLEPLFNEYGRLHYGSGLLRIAYLKGNREFDHELYGGSISCDKEPCRSSLLKKFKKQSVRWNKDFHVFTLIWKPGGFQLLVDDEDYENINYEMADNILNIGDMPHAEVWQRGTSMSPFDQLFYISLGVRVGGINDFADTPEKPWMNNNTKAMFKFWKNSHIWKKTWVSPELIVDYVRVYSL